MRHKLIVCYFLARNILLMPCHFWHQNYDVQIFLLFFLASNAQLQRTVLFWCQWQHSCTILFFKQKWVYIWSHIFCVRNHPPRSCYISSPFLRNHNNILSVWCDIDIWQMIYSHFYMLMENNATSFWLALSNTIKG